LFRLDSYPMVARTVFLVTLACVLLLTLLPVRFLPDLGMTVTLHDDKLEHAIAFAVLAALGSLGWPEHKTRLIVLLALTGAAIEVLQGAQFIGRDMDVFDWVADCAGMVCGLTIANWTKRRVGGLP
jgi:glycopeptide antibiotics resistance protein